MPIGEPKSLTLCKRFFSQPRVARQRMYEALRAYYVDGRPSQAGAATVPRIAIVDVIRLRSATAAKPEDQGSPSFDERLRSVVTPYMRGQRIDLVVSSAFVCAQQAGIDITTDLLAAAGNN